MLVCSAGFVADHLEVLFDLDIEAKQIAEEAGIVFARTRMPNADPEYLDVLAQVVRDHLADARCRRGEPRPAARRVVVIGGGVTGLTIGVPPARRPIPRSTSRARSRHAVRAASSARVQVGDLVLPAGADSFLARKPWAVELVQELGIGDELVAPGATGAHLWTERGLVPLPKEAPFGIPGDIGEVFRWPGLSPAGRRRAAQDLLRRSARTTSDETLGSLLRRRLGDEATDRAVAPLLAGLYAGDVDRLSRARDVPRPGGVGVVAGKPDPRVRRPRSAVARRREPGSDVRAASRRR